MRKNYNKPTTEIALFRTETLLQGLTVSVNGGTPPGGMHAPRRGTGIPY